MSNLVVEIGNTALKAAWSEKMTLGKTFRYQGEKYTDFILSLTHREKPASVIYMGFFAGEALILTENGQQQGAIQIAGTPETIQVPFFLASCDYTIIGDEYYAAAAYLSREPTMLGSLAGQDLGKATLILYILAGTLVFTLTALGIDNSFLEFCTRILFYYNGD